MKSQKPCLDDNIHDIIMQKFLKNKVICFGAGQRGYNFVYAMKKLGLKITYFVDNDKKKQNRINCGVECFPPEIIENQHTVVISSANNYGEIKSQLLNRGITDIYSDAEVYKLFAKELNKEQHIDDVINKFNDLLYEVFKYPDEK